MFTVAWENNVCPDTFKEALIILIPKSDKAITPDQTRPIALTNTHGKIFFTIVSGRIQNHLSQFSINHQAIQKGGVQEMSGCLEHTTLLTKALQDARQHERQISVTWLDFKNAFGSVKHNLIQFALLTYGIHIDIRSIIHNYYDGLHFVVKHPEGITSSVPFSIGLFQGCCLSMDLFNLIVNMLFDKLQNMPPSMHYSFCKNNNIRVPLCLAFVDDLTIVTKNVASTNKVIQVVESFTTWTSCLKLNHAKCKSLLLKRCGTKFGPYEADIKISGKQVQAIHQGVPFKWLGKRFKHNGMEEPGPVILEDYYNQMKTVNDLPLSGTRRTWLYQHIVIPRLSWPFLIYDIGKGILTKMEAKSNAYLKDWLSLAKPMDTSMLYRSTEHFGFGLMSVMTYYNQFRITRRHLLKSSSDEAVKMAAEEECKLLEPMENRKNFHRKFLEKTQTTKLGLGYMKKKKTDQQLMRGFVRDDQMHSFTVHAHNLETQQDWTVVGDYCLPPEIMWKAFLYDWTPQMVKFYANSLQNTLPDPRNLERWGKINDSKCPLCGWSPCNAKHLLVVCKKALEEGRFTYRHDKVLEVVREALSLGLAISRKPRITKPMVQFVKEGQKLKRLEKKSMGTPSVRPAPDWKILMDSNNKHYKLPAEIAVVELYPDLLAYSLQTKQIIIVELTVPWETNIPQQHLYKTNKYHVLESEARMNGFSTQLFAVEVGARGLPSKDMYAFLKKMGVGRRKEKEFLNRMSREALKASYLLWLRRDEQWQAGEGNVVAT